MTKLQKINKVADLLYKIGESELHDCSGWDERLFVLLRLSSLAEKIEVKLELKNIAEQILKVIEEK